MAQTYTRQSTFSDGDTITASLFNDEYNQLVNAFAYSSTDATSTGHRHDGTAGQGGNIPKIGDLDFKNKLEVDSTNNRWGFFVEVSSAAVEQIRIQDGAIVPVTDNDIDLGTSSLEFKNLYIDGTATIDDLTVDASAVIGTTLLVGGATTLSGDVTLGNASADTLVVNALVNSNFVPESDSLWNLGSTSLYWANAYVDAITTTGDVAVGGNLTVTGNATISGNLTFGDADTDTITLGADVASHITPDADDTYDLGSSTKEWRNLYIDGTANIDSLVADTADINAGTIDNTSIGVTTASTGNFSTLSINGTAITATAAELNIMDGVTSTTAELNILDGVTATAAELNVLDGVTAFVDEDDMVSNSATSIPSQQSVKAYVDSQVTAQDLDFQGDSGGALSIDLDSETLTIAGGTGIDTTGATNTLTVAIDSTVATLTGTQTLTNKTLTSPDVNTPDIDGGTIDNTVIGGSTAAAGTFTTFTSNGIDDNASSTAITIASGGATTFSGDVILEESTPKLQFQDTDITDSLFELAHTGGAMYVRSRGGTSAYGDIRFQRNNDGATHLNVFRTTTAGDVLFYDDDGSTEGMRWDASTDRLGIGVQTPVTSLHIRESDVGAFTSLGRQIATFERSAAAYINLIAGTTASTGIDFGDIDDVDAGSFRFDNNDNSFAFRIADDEKVRISSNGNVLIGRTDDTLGGGNGEDLQIGSGGGGAGLTIHSSTSSNGDIQFADGTTGNASYRGLIRYLHSSDDLSVWTAGAERIRLDSSGNLGIGTTAPSAYSNASELVVDTGLAGGITVVSDSTSGGYGALYFADGTTGDEQYRGFFQYNHNNSGTDEMLIGTAGATRVTIASDGDVDISGNLEAGDGTDISMGSLSPGQLKIMGSGYQGAIALDATGMHIYHNSGSRSIIFGTNETERFRIAANGALAVGGASNYGSSGQVLTSNGNAAPSWQTSPTGIALTDLSVTTNSVGIAALSYNNSTGVFSYTPPDLSNYATTNANDNISAHWEWQDAYQIRFGNSADSRMYWDGTSNRFIHRNYTHGSDMLWQAENAGGTNVNMLYLDPDDGGYLYHSGSVKLQTVSGGVTVTGTATATAFSGDGSSLTSVDADTVDGIQAASFLRSDANDTATGTVTFNGRVNIRGHIDLSDNEYLYFGSGDDVEFFCNGSHMYTDLNSGIGNWYIRDGSTTRFTFDDAGHFTATGNVTAYSDERLKDDIETLDGSKVYEMRGVSFTKNGEAGSGVIAQELQKVAPELVMEQEADGYLSVAYGNIVGYLIEAVKEQKKEIDRLKEMIENGSSN